MNTLTEISLALPEMPGFDDGMVDMRELIRTMAESPANEIMGAQADIMCEEQGNSRNGYRERTLIISVGPIGLRIPKVGMGSYFPDGLIERYSRTDRAVIGAVSEMVAKGVSTRKAERIASRMGIPQMSASQVSRICASLDDTVSDLRERTFADAVFPYLRLDATYIKARDGGRVSSTAVVTAIGAGAVLAEPGWQWSDRRWFSQESMDEVLDKAKPAPDPAYEGTAAEHAQRNNALIVADHGKTAQDYHSTSIRF